MEYRLSKFKNDIANQFGHSVFYNKVLIRVFYYLLEKRINTRILFLMTMYRRVLHKTNILIQCKPDLKNFIPQHVEETYFNEIFQLCLRKQNEAGQFVRTVKLSSVATYLYSLKDFVEFLSIRNNPNTNSFAQWTSVYYLSRWQKSLNEERKRWHAEKEGNSEVINSLHIVSSDFDLRTYNGHSSISLHFCK